MFKNTKIIAMLLCASVAAPTLAQTVDQTGVEAGHKEHLIFIQADGYFPEISYVKPGDRARFVNSSDENHEVISADESWGTGPIAIGNEIVLVIQGGMDMAFHNKANIEEAGELTFDDPPLD